MLRCAFWYLTYHPHARLSFRDDTDRTNGGSPSAETVDPSLSSDPRFRYLFGGACAPQSCQHGVNQGHLGSSRPVHEPHTQTSELPAFDLPYDPILLLHCCGTLAWILAYPFLDSLRGERSKTTCSSSSSLSSSTSSTLSTWVFTFLLAIRAGSGAGVSGQPNFHHHCATLIIVSG